MEKYTVTDYGSKSTKSGKGKLEKEIVIEGELHDASVDSSPKRLLLLNMTISKDTSRKQKVLTILFIS